MLRRLLCLGVLLMPLLGSVACNSDSSKPVTKSTMPDPEGNVKPKPGGTKAG